MFPLDDYNCELLNSLTDDVITGKDLADELDKINKPTELRMIKKNKIERRFEIDYRAKKIYLNSEI